MKFKVRVSNGELTLGIVMIVLFSVVAAGVIALVIYDPVMRKEKTWMIMLGIAAIFIGLGFYYILRPRVEVSDNNAVFYPKHGRKRIVDLNDITKKLTFRSSDASAPPVGIMGYSATGGKMEYGSDYAYFSGNKELMRIGGRMKNADRLDRIITEIIHAKQEPSECEEEE